MPYVNPYYVTQPVVVEQPVVVGQPDASAAYNYAMPLDTQAPPPEQSVTDQAEAVFDQARDAFAGGDYNQALQLVNQAIAKVPNDATLHEFRALCLFALKQYDQAAATLYAVLSAGPGWDWTTLIGLYPSAEVYTQQLRALEAFVKANPRSASARFVLAYHYLTQGHTDAAVAQLKDVVALQPGDRLAAQLIRQFDPAQTAAAPAQPTSTPDAQPAAPAREGNLTGNWTASPAPGTSITLTIGGDGAFTWKVASPNNTQTMQGKESYTNGILTLASDNQRGAMVGNVTWQNDDQFTFKVLGAGPEDAGLTFKRS
jgi:tetratricopeptide (TPR) repeat protein